MVLTPDLRYLTGGRLACLGHQMMMYMTAMPNDRKKRLGIPLVSLLLIVSFAFIPVRCDASAAPHSIFVSPTMLGMTSPAAHQHHSGGAAPQQTVPGHDPAMRAAAMDHTSHHHEASESDSTDPSPSEESSPRSLANSGDPQSQQPVGATLDLPTTSVTPISTMLLPLEREPLLLVLPVAAALHGMTVRPEAPPPKAS